jgi:hypothetical protein
MPVLELTEEQLIILLKQLSEEQKKRVLAQMSNFDTNRPRPQFGSAKDDIASIANDFDAPLEDFKEYM